MNVMNPIDLDGTICLSKDSTSVFAELEPFSLMECENRKILMQLCNTTLSVQITVNAMQLKSVK